jgi:hypothetical protein
MENARFVYSGILCSKIAFFTDQLSLDRMESSTFPLPFAAKPAYTRNCFA